MFGKQNTLFIFCFLILFLLPSYLSANQNDPFYSRNQNPFVQVYGLPPMEPGYIAPEGEVKMRFVEDIANNDTYSYNNDEIILMDGESYRTDISIRYGIFKDYEVGIDIPYISHETGIFDHFIDDWHDFFGLPEGDRDKRDRNLLEYTYIRNNWIVYRIKEPSRGVGDIILSGAYQILRDSTRDPAQSLAFRMSVKLPTGSSDELHGSGGTDIAIRLNGSDSATLKEYDISCWASLGVAYLGKGEILEEIRKDFVGFGSLGMAWGMFDWSSLKLQVDYHTAVYKSDLGEIGKGAMQLDLGGTIEFPKNIFFDINIIEDIMVDTTPDVVFQFVLRRTF
jgi:hypothetical protein